MKRCNTCHTERDESEFYPKNARCKICTSIRSKELYQNRKNNGIPLNRLHEDTRNTCQKIMEACE